MYKITLLPQVGILIDGVGQVDFGASKDHVLGIFGPNDHEKTEHRWRYSKYGFFADFDKTDSTFRAVEFWNDYDKNVSEVFIFGREVLRTAAEDTKKLLFEKNGNQAPNDGWFVDIDVIYSGGSQKSVLAIIEQEKTDGIFEGEYKNSLLLDLERAQYFSSFGIGYRGYCRDGLSELQAMSDR
jgi:hypothetical protein